jgi:septal ring factor EnvC (AmiA/AmiB activator)
VTDPQFGALMVLVGALVTAAGVWVKERVTSRSIITVGEMTSKDAFIGKLVARLEAVEKSAVECEERNSKQGDLLAQRSMEIASLRFADIERKEEMSQMRQQIENLRRVNRRLEAQISAMENRNNGRLYLPRSG